MYTKDPSPQLLYLDWSNLACENLACENGSNYIVMAMHYSFMTAETAEWTELILAWVYPKTFHLKMDNGQEASKVAKYNIS